MRKREQLRIVKQHMRTNDPLPCLLRPISYNKKDFNILSYSPEQLQKARKLAAKACGLKDRVKLFTSRQLKIDKSNKKGKEYSIVMHFAANDFSGYNVCPCASKGCKKACLTFSGQGRFAEQQLGRIKKTQLFYEHRELFFIIMHAEMETWVRKAEKLGLTLAVRLNGTSDIQWEKIMPWLFVDYHMVQFYDYTKVAKRIGKAPDNYHLTFSRSESNHKATNKIIAQGGNVAIVFSNLDKVLKTGYKGRQVVDGIESDRRFADPKGIIVGLKPLWHAKKDRTGFVLEN